MDQPPAGAQYSPDGAYWWDEEEQQWKSVAQAGQAGGSAANSGSAIDTAGLVATLEAIASMDEEALARSSSYELDAWIDSLNQWHEHLSQQGEGIA